jgi:O-antigen/teichoic acid export membrane protein
MRSSDAVSDIGHATPGRSSLAESISRNTFFGLVSNLTQVVTRLVTVPLVIRHLGLDGYGIWNIVMMTATYLRFGSVGIKTAFQKYVAEATGNGDFDRANKLLSTGCALMLGLSVAVSVPVVMFSPQIAKATGVPGAFLPAAADAVALLAITGTIANVGAAFEATLMGGHRIDLVRKFSTLLTICEAVAIVAALSAGLGLVSMAVIMGTSELLYVSACFVAARRVIPQIRIRPAFVTKSVVYELMRFGGSYQCVNFLEVLYGSILPVVVMRTYGPQLAGVYAVVTRVVGIAGTIQEPILGPILSGAAMVYASRSAKRMQLFVTKAFKVTLGLSLFPLGFVAIFGTTLAYAWTGERIPSFRVAFGLVSARALFASISLLALVLYRSSGKATMDNLRQVLRLGILLALVVFARNLGFNVLLAVTAIAELGGMLFMVFALTRTFQDVSLKELGRDTVRLAIAAALALGSGRIALYLPIPEDPNGRLTTLVRLAAVSITCLIAAVPIVRLTGSVTAEEGSVILGGILRGRGSS